MVIYPSPTVDRCDTRVEKGDGRASALDEAHSDLQKKNVWAASSVFSGRDASGD